MSLISCKLLVSWSCWILLLHYSLISKIQWNAVLQIYTSISQVDTLFLLCAPCYRWSPGYKWLKLLLKRHFNCIYSCCNDRILSFPAWHRRSLSSFKRFPFLTDPAIVFVSRILSQEIKSHCPGPEFQCLNNAGSLGVKDIGNIFQGFLLKYF